MCWWWCFLFLFVSCSSVTSSEEQPLPSLPVLIPRWVWFHPNLITSSCGGGLFQHHNKLDLTASKTVMNRFRLPLDLLCHFTAIFAWRVSVITVSEAVFWFWSLLRQRKVLFGWVSHPSVALVYFKQIMKYFQQLINYFKSIIPKYDVPVCFRITLCGRSRFCLVFNLA